MPSSEVRCGGLFLIIVALLVVALAGCRATPDDGSLAASSPPAEAESPWPEEKALGSISSLLAENFPSIVAATGLMAYDTGGVGLAFSVSREEVTSPVTVFVTFPYWIPGDGPRENEISVRGDKRVDMEGRISWSYCSVPVGSPVEAKLVELAQKVAETAVEPVERHNAKELLAVLKDREYPCKWRIFWYGHEKIGAGYGARYREKYGDE